MSDKDVLDSPHGGNRVGLVLDFVSKYHNETIPEDEIIKFLRGEPTGGSKFWFHYLPTMNFEVQEKYYRTAGEQHVGVKIFAIEGSALTAQRFPASVQVRAGGLELLPLRRISDDTEIILKLFADDIDRAVIRLPDFFAVLARRQAERENTSTVGIVGYVSIEHEVQVLDAYWKDGWHLTSYDLFDRKKIKAKWPKGTEIIRRTFWC